MVAHFSSNRPNINIFVKLVGVVLLNALKIKPFKEPQNREAQNFEVGLGFNQRSNGDEFIINLVIN